MTARPEAAAGTNSRRRDERGRRARVEDVHELALGMPGVRVEHGPRGNPVYQVGGKSFVFFRTARPDAVDPATGERYRDVIEDAWLSRASPSRRRAWLSAHPAGGRADAGRS